jgi:hypothetical protein
VQVSRSYSIHAALGAVALAFAAGCGGGEQSVASKSAAAYREAVASGRTIAAGHDHGHGGVDPATGTGVDHAGRDAAAAGAAVGHDAMDHGTPGARVAAGHDAAGHTTTSGGPADHRPMAGSAAGHEGHAAATASSSGQHGAMQHGTTASPSGDAHAGHAAPASPQRDAHAGHAAPVSPQHDAPPAMQHAPSADDPHAQHRAAAPAGTPSPMTDAPRTSREISRLGAGSALQPDRFDRPRPEPVAEAARAAAGAGHDGHDLRDTEPGEDHAHPSAAPAPDSPQTPPHDHGSNHTPPDGTRKQ